MDFKHKQVSGEKKNNLNFLHLLFQKVVFLNKNLTCIWNYF